MKSILIVGKDSYIGESLKKWIEQYPDRYMVDIVSSLNEKWKTVNFSNYEVVVNVAGIAHINNIKDSMQSLFYSINRDLSIEIAVWAKMHNVKHFIVMSSMNVYGEYVNGLCDRKLENPTNFYGDSKLQGDIGVRKLEDSSFVVSCIRPPFVYGKGCKGNYNTISKIAKKTPIFPKYINKKSMIYIDNLCEFIRLVVDACLGGILTPQNKELMSSYNLVNEITKCNEKKIIYTKLFNWLIKPSCIISKIARKAFSNDYYNQDLSNYWDYKYCVFDFKESIRITESK